VIAQGDGFFRRELPGGVRLVGEVVPGRRSAAVGIWLRVGSRDEEIGAEGLAHFIEHLVFKGTGRRSARDIAYSLEREGGSLDAFTTKDATCFYARVLEGQVDLAMDVLGDLVSHPRFDPADVEVERQVVLEELRSAEDTPEDLVSELAQRYLWPDHILGSSILGTLESLDRLNAPAVGAFHRTEYRAPRVVVSAAGAVSPERLEALITRHLELDVTPALERRRRPAPAPATLALHEADLSQLHLVLMSPAPAEGDPDKRSAQIATEILGGGMASRLFQAVREADGLAYSVQAYTEHFDDAGMFGISLTVSPDRAEEAIARTRSEMERLLRDGLEPGELDGAKAQVRGSLVMGLESLTNRMSHLARTEYRKRAPVPVEEIQAEFDRVTADEALASAARLFDPAVLSLIALGPVRRRTLEFKAFGKVVEVPAA
jgi:predicted Zn-dependent peptidase